MGSPKKKIEINKQPLSEWVQEWAYPAVPNRSRFQGMNSQRACRLTYQIHTPFANDFRHGCRAPVLPWGGNTRVSGSACLPVWSAVSPVHIPCSTCSGAITFKPVSGFQWHIYIYICRERTCCREPGCFLKDLKVGEIQTTKWDISEGGCHLTNVTSWWMLQREDESSTYLRIFALPSSSSMFIHKYQSTYGAVVDRAHAVQYI